VLRIRGLLDVFAFAGTFLSVTATLALMRVLADRSPRLALIGGSLNLIGWIALVGALMGAVVAVQMVRDGSPTPALIDPYRNIVNSPTMIALEATVGLEHRRGAVARCTRVRRASRL
jgi:hypothetical protein